MKFKKFLFSFISIVLIPVYLAATMPFKDVPKDHWAYGAVEELSERGIVIGYDGKASNEFIGENKMTRYEFAHALLKTIHKLEAETGVSRATGVIDEVNVNELMAKSSLNKKDMELLKKLILEFQKELADMNLRLTEVETKQRNMEISDSSMPFYISIGAAVISVIALVIAIIK